MGLDVANGAFGLVQGTGSIYLAYAGVSGSFPYYQPIETTMYYGALPIYGATKIDWDADALDFVQTASVSDPNQMVGINNLVKALKSGSNPWGDIERIYPFAGQDYTRNLKNPSNQLTFGSAMTSGSLGITGDGTSNSYADTGQNSVGRTISYGVFVVDDVAEDKVDFGCRNSSISPSYEMYLKTRMPANVARTTIDQGDSPYIQAAVTSSRGFTSVIAEVGTLYLYKEGNLLVSGSQTGPSLIDFGPTWAIGAYGVGSSTFTNNSTKTYGFAFFAQTTLTSTQMSELNDAVQDYITLLNR